MKPAYQNPFKLELIIAIFLLLVASAYAEETPAEPDNNGIAFKFTHKSDLMANTTGGVSRGMVWLANSEARVNLDLGKLADWNDTTAYVQYHLQHGAKSINKHVGSLAGVDNIESKTNAGQFFQAWLQKNSADNSLSLLAGLYAIDSEFYSSESAGLFFMPPVGMSTEMSQTGRNGPPIFPTGALGIRVKYTNQGFYLQGALTDGAPGDPNNTQGTQIRLGDGTLAIVELGSSVEGKAPGKTAFGFWRYTTPVQDLSYRDTAGNLLQRADRGCYFLAERSLIPESLQGFFRLGFANKQAYQVEWTGSLGLNYQIDGNDTAGIALASSHASEKYRLLNGAKSSETILEITYRRQLRPWLAVQPMLQRIYNPNMDARLPDALLAGVRLEASF